MDASSTMIRRLKRECRRKLTGSGSRSSGKTGINSFLVYFFFSFLVPSMFFDASTLVCMQLSLKETLKLYLSSSLMERECDCCRANPRVTAVLSLMRNWRRVVVAAQVSSEDEIFVSLLVSFWEVVLLLQFSRIGLCLVMLIDLRDWICSACLWLWTGVIHIRICAGYWGS